MSECIYLRENSERHTKKTTHEVFLRIATTQRNPRGKSCLITGDCAAEDFANGRRFIKSRCARVRCRKINSVTILLCDCVQYWTYELYVNGLHGCVASCRPFVRVGGMMRVSDNGLFGGWVPWLFRVGLTVLHVHVCVCVSVFLCQFLLCCLFSSRCYLLTRGPFVLP